MYIGVVCCEGGDIFGQFLDEGDVFVLYDVVVGLFCEQKNGVFFVGFIFLICDVYVLLMKVRLVVYNFVMYNFLCSYIIMYDWRFKLKIFVYVMFMFCMVMKVEDIY